MQKAIKVVKLLTNILLAMSHLLYANNPPMLVVVYSYVLIIQNSKLGKGNGYGYETTPKCQIPLHCSTQLKHIVTAPPVHSTSSTQLEYIVTTPPVHGTSSTQLEYIVTTSPVHSTSSTQVEYIVTTPPVHS